MGVDKLVKEISDIFGNFNNNIDEAVRIITTSPQSNDSMWTIVNNVYSIIIVIALTLAVLYFFIDFLNKSIMFEYVKWENVVKSMLKLIVAKEIITHTRQLMNGIFLVVANLTKDIGLNASHINNIDFTALSKSLSENTSFLDRIGLMIRLMPLNFLMWIIMMAILVIAYGRMIQIYIYTAFAPIPLASLAGEGGINGSAKSFIKDYVAVCLQGTVIIVSFALFGGILKDVGLATIDGLKNMILYGLVLLFVLVKSGSWSKKIIGG